MEKFTVLLFVELLSSDEWNVTIKLTSIPVV